MRPTPRTLAILLLGLAGILLGVTFKLNHLMGAHTLFNVGVILTDPGRRLVGDSTGSRAGRMIRLMLASVVGVLWGAPSLCAQLCGQDHDAQVSAIHARADQLKDEQPRLVLLGSSSFRFWPSTDTVFSHFEVVNAGFGGSCFQDAWRLRDTLVYALNPDVLLIYEGDNDLHDRVPIDDIVTTASAFLQEVLLRMPDLDVVVIAPKASPARYHLKD